jgi:hypothetical protein
MNYILDLWTFLFSWIRYVGTLIGESYIDTCTLADLLSFLIVLIVFYLIVSCSLTVPIQVQ